MAAVKDKATAFKNEIAGTQTNKIVCKAASHEIAGPKKKHVDCKLFLAEFIFVTCRKFADLP